MEKISGKTNRKISISPEIKVNKDIINIITELFLRYLNRLSQLTNRSH